MTSVLDLPPADPAPTAGTRPLVEVVVPVHDEERVLDASVRRLHRHLRAELPYRFRITVADNASTDRTAEVGRALARELPEVRFVHLDRKGRGLALATVWSVSDADVLAYLDVDLSTDLDALLPLVAPLVSGHSDVAIGTRLGRGARVLRQPGREVVSQCYNLLLRATLAARFSDAQCGFKAVRRDVARRLLPLVRDTSWFFDTELLVLAERAGLRIHEVPVDWVDDPDSRVDVVRTALDDLRGVGRLARSLATGRLPLDDVRAAVGRPAVTAQDAGLLTHAARFAVVGVASTLAYAVLFLLLHPVLGAQGANVVALLVTAVANTSANRRFTFGVSGPGRVRHQAQGLLVLGLGLGLTSGSLAVLHAVAPTSGRAVELGVLLAASAAATVLRFALLRAWVFARREPTSVDPSTSTAPPRSSRGALPQSALPQHPLPPGGS